MYVIYVDECGYQAKWPDEKAMKEQPVYVVSAVAVDAGNVELVYKRIRDGIAQLELPEIDARSLGKGQEIKARAVDKGDGFWSKRSDLRAKVRELYLNQAAVTYFVVCIDKVRHYEKYQDPENPANLGLQYLLERIQGFLKEHEEQGLIIIDATPRIEPQREFLRELLLEGSWGIAISRFYGIPYEWRLEMENIIEIHFGNSLDSLGIQIADFVARHTYSWWKSGKRQDYPGWNYILPKLWKYPNHEGWGYKEFP